MEEVTADVVEIARALELEAELKMGLNCCNLLVKPGQMRSCFLWMSKKKWFLEKKSIPGEDTVKVKVVSHVQLFASHGQAPLSCQAPLSTGHNY